MTQKKKFKFDLSKLSIPSAEEAMQEMLEARERVLNLQRLIKQSKEQRDRHED